jgi:hypothetical protein
VAEWMPIESAPKLTRVLLWDGTWVSAGAWTDYDCMGWVMDCYDFMHDGSSSPTHWMPLPEPPKGETP